DDWTELSDGPLVLRYRLRGDDKVGIRPSGDALVVGDDAEFNPGAPAQNLSGGVPIQLDADARTLVIATSIIGLPPVYTLRSNGVTAVASDIHLFRDVPGVRLALD